MESETHVSQKENIFNPPTHTSTPPLPVQNLPLCENAHVAVACPSWESWRCSHRLPQPSQKRASPKMFTRCQCIRVMHDTLQRDLLVLGFTRQLTKSSILLAVLACAWRVIPHTGTNIYHQLGTGTPYSLQPLAYSFSTNHPVVLLHFKKYFVFYPINRNKIFIIQGGSNMTRTICV